MRPSITVLSVAVVLHASSINVSGQTDDVLYNGCDLQNYYAGLWNSDMTGLREDVTRQELEALLESTHRKVLPYTGRNDQDDVWKALIDLDHGPNSSSSSSSSNNNVDTTVRLIYRQTDVPARPYGTSDTWNREHLWPKSLGVEYSGPDFTDVHHLRACDWNVNSARNNLYFGACGIGEPQSECSSPAHPEAAPDTASDSVTFLPPAVVRGDVARAIFYMDVRFSNQNNDDHDRGLDLTLTDCPTNQPHEMAYKSQLLEWHAADEVSEQERDRNQRACERWQGNRNVFVDFPELVTKVFGEPQLPLGDGLGYPGCDASSTTPTEEVNNPSTTLSPNLPTIPITAGGIKDCSGLSPGDIFMTSMNSDSPEYVAFVTLQDLGEGLVFFLTDNAWTGSFFRANEGSVSFRVPAGGIAAGSVFGFGTLPDLMYSAEWESERGQIQLSASGDTILLYCMKDDSNNDAIHHLNAVDYSGSGWMESNLPESDYGTSNSALPGNLASPQLGGLALPHFDNYKYTGSTEGTVAELRASLSDPNQWYGSNDPNHGVFLSSFRVQLPDGETSPSERPNPSPGDVMVVGMNSENPDLVALIALESLPGNFEIYLTDNAWTGGSFRTNEGTKKLTLPSTGVAAGTIFGYGENILYGEDWESVGGRFALSEDGDVIMIYTRRSEDDEVVHLGAFSYNGVNSWLDYNGMSEEAFDTSSSSLPNSLSSVGAISLPRQNNYIYVGPTSGSKAFLQSSLQDARNWQGSSTTIVQISTEPFTVQQSTASSTPSISLLTVFVGSAFLLMLYHC